MLIQKWAVQLFRWLKSFFIREQPTKIFWFVVPMTYEKWVNPSNKNDKHYRVIYRSNTGERRVGDEKFKRASEALAFANQFISEGRN